MEGTSDEQCYHFRRARRPRQLERHAIAASGRRISRMMRKNGLVSAYSSKKAPAFWLKAKRGPAAEPTRQALRRARAPRPCRKRPDVRAHRTEAELRLPVGRPLQPRDHRALGRQPARLRPDEGGVRHRGPLSDIEAFHTDRGSEFANVSSIDEMIEVFGIERSLSEKGCPYDNA